MVRYVAAPLLSLLPKFLRAAFCLIVLGMITLLASPSLSSPRQTTADLACENSPCSPEQVDIWDGYLRAEPLSRSLNNTLFSGPCFHSSPQYAPANPHYGVALIERKKQDLYFHFQLHLRQDTTPESHENPYAHWTLEDARRSLPRHYNDFWKLKFTEDHAYLEFAVRSKGASVTKYSIRQSGGLLWIIGAISDRPIFFCHWKKNVR